jgi:hypothetical protein
MQKELASCGDSAVATFNTAPVTKETVGVDGFYQVICRDSSGNVKWEEGFPNLVNQGGKELMFDTLLRTAGTYTTVGPFLGLIDGTSPTFAASDTMTSHAGWAEFTNCTVGGSAVRGTAVFAAATSAGSTPTNVTVTEATPVTFTITGAGGTVSGCFLVTGTGANSTQNNTSGTLYSAGAFAVAKTTTAGDTVSVTYSTSATS